MGGYSYGWQNARMFFDNRIRMDRSN